MSILTLACQWPSFLGESARVASDVPTERRLARPRVRKDCRRRAHRGIGGRGRRRAGQRRADDRAWPKISACSCWQNTTCVFSMQLLSWGIMFPAFGCLGESAKEFDPTSGRIGIYVLIDPRDSTVRYVGASRDPRTRLSAHHSEGFSKKSIWLLELLGEEALVLLAVVEDVSLDDSTEAERRWISAYREHGDLLNGANTPYMAWKPRPNPFACRKRLPSHPVTIYKPDREQIRYRRKQIEKRFADRELAQRNLRAFIASLESRRAP
jgi:hypothetical protein